MIELGHLAAIGSMICSGIATILFKSQSDKVKPAGVNILKIVPASIAFVITSLVIGNIQDITNISWTAFIPLVSAAIFGIVGGDLLYLPSQHLIGVSKAYPIGMSYPLLTYIFSMIFFKEEFKLTKFLGIIIVILGISLIASSKTTDKKTLPKKSPNIDMGLYWAMTHFDSSLNRLLETNGTKSSTSNNEPPKNEPNLSIFQQQESSSPSKKAFILGIFLAILASFTWATGTTLIKFGLNQTEVTIIPINTARMLFLVPISFSIFIGTNRGKRKSYFSKTGILLICIGGILGLFAGNILYLWGVDTVGPSTSAAINASAPLVATPLSIIFLKEKINLRIILGTLLTTGGILLIILIP
ncbi:MAG: EamA family transporter [Candidatus Heimdallarchaeota archaeon]|nr:EamA family transporter [Candidatus Heimdallarchaeota archaeon]